MKIRPVEVEMFHANVQMEERTDGRADQHDESNTRLSQNCESA